MAGDIQRCRDAHLDAALTHERSGISLEDVGVASLFATFEIARRLKGGDPVAAIEYLRLGADLMERQMMEGTLQ